MKNQITATALLLLAMMLMAACESKTSENKTEETQQTENAMYQCPMKCEGDKMYDKPGQCPVCNMDLQKVESNHEHGGDNHTH